MGQGKGYGQVKYLTLGLLLALSGSTIGMEAHPDGSITLPPAEAAIVDFQVGEMKSTIGKLSAIVKYLERRVQELEKGVCI